MTDTPRERALKILTPSYNSGDPKDARRSARAQAFATLAVADAIDRLTETIRKDDDESAT